MQISAALPRLTDSMAGEGAGLAYGALLAGAVIADNTDLGILGDNLPVIRLGAANGRIRTDRVWVEVEDALLTLARRRLPLHWYAVRRHLNKAADALATEGVFVGLRMKAEGQSDDTVIFWCNENEFRERSWIIPERIPCRPDAQLLRANRPIANFSQLDRRE